MFSVIIPTMWRKPQVIKKLLETLYIDKSIKEIIIIGNDTKPDDIILNNKIIYLPQTNNIYVNPAWNLGVENSNCDKIALINDDILIPNNLFKYLDTINLKDYGIIGASYKTTEAKISSYQDWEENNISLQPEDKRNNPFGILMCFDKSHYYKIPEELKIYCGDDLLFYINKNVYKKQNMIINCLIKTDMSSTTSDTKFSTFLHRERSIYYDYLKSNNL